MVLAITPVTNPTSTVLFKAIVAAKTRNAVLFRPSPYAMRSCERSVEILRDAAEAAGMPPGALQVIPDAAHEVTHYLFKHPKVDFVWVTGGPKIVALANASGKPGVSVGPGNAPIYIHKTADVKGAVVDILISKTFDSSVICPAEQTCIIDDEIYDEMIAEFERMGARLLSDEEAAKIAEFAFGCGDKVSLDAVGQKASELAARAGFTVSPTVKVLLAPLPSDLDELAAHPLVAEKLMPVLGVVRARDVQHGIDAAVLVTEHGGLGHTSAIYANDDDVIERVQPGGAHGTHSGQRAHRGRCPRRHLQQPDADVLAGLRHLGRVEHHRERQLPPTAQHQDRGAPADPAAVVPGAVEHLLQRGRAGQPARTRLRDGRGGHRRADRGARGGGPGAQQAAHPSRAGVQRGDPRAGRGDRSAAASRCCSGPSPTC